MLAAAAGAALSGLLAAPGPAHAIPAPLSAPSLTSTDIRSGDWVYVRYLAGSDSRSTVKAAAWKALTSSSVDAAIARFIVSDFPFAKKRAADAKVRNADFARRVLATHTAEFAPEVHAAARYALDHTDADRDYFARTGYAAAKERDRVAREATGEQAAALAQTDRDFVALLRDHDPGEQVRAAATFALRPAATDADLVEFFAHDWVGAAALDLEAFRLGCVDADMLWRATSAGLVTRARAAEQAARDAAGEAATQLRDAAARAWREAGAQTGPARVAWAQAQLVAEEQAANWQQVAQVAGAATGLNWHAIAGTAGATADSWAAERQNAAEQAAYWQALYAEALAGERRTTPTDGAA
ncbi:hypothetical protein [Actinoplanes auranticolor]|uniref:Uncharacterized protein n=1 Tax=Actinoplanes auranticolor TaxID=47988 RepID=A0A919VQX5_9ACTN|nr:hypothetical protein [Actinoplanes auranticolor]GIM66052.1 hypothetical protein Aau02nite_21450 [Actinoplanes auranticolor]